MYPGGQSATPLSQCSIHKLTSSSMSKNAADRASWMPDRGVAPLRTTVQPLRPLPSASHPATPFSHGADSTRYGVCVAPDPVPVAIIVRISGNPSWLTSPSFRGIGSEGLLDVSRTRRDGMTEDPRGAGNISSRGILTHACEIRSVDY